MAKVAGKHGRNTYRKLFYTNNKLRKKMISRSQNASYFPEICYFCFEKLTNKIKLLEIQIQYNLPSMVTATPSPVTPRFQAPAVVVYCDFFFTFIQLFSFVSKCTDSNLIKKFIVKSVLSQTNRMMIFEYRKKGLLLNIQKCYQSAF